MITKHKFHSKDTTSNVWMVWCPIHRSSFSTITWDQGVCAKQTCPYCMHHVNDMIEVADIQTREKKRVAQTVAKQTTILQDFGIDNPISGADK